MFILVEKRRVQTFRQPTKETYTYWGRRFAIGRITGQIDHVEIGGNNIVIQEEQAAFADENRRNKTFCQVF